MGRVLQRGQVPLGIQGGHAAGAGGRYGLPVGEILHVAAGENAVHVGFARAGQGFEVALLVVVQVILENVGVRVVADGDEEAGDGYFAGFLREQVFHPHGFHGVLAQNLIGRRVPDNLNLGVVQHSLLHDFRGPHFALTHYHVHFGAQISQIRGFLRRRIAGAHDGHVLPPVEKAVAHRAGRHARAIEALFRVQAQPLGRGTGRDNHGISRHFDFLVNRNAMRATGKVHGRGHAVAHIGAEPLGLLLEVFHHGRPHHPVRVAGKVLHVVGDGELPAGLHSLVHDGVEAGAGGVDGGRVAGRAGADDEQMCVFHNEL